MVYTEIRNSKSVVFLVMDPIRPTKNTFSRPGPSRLVTNSVSTIKIYVIPNVAPKNLKFYAKNISKVTFIVMEERQNLLCRKSRALRRLKLATSTAWGIDAIRYYVKEMACFRAT